MKISVTGAGGVNLVVAAIILSNTVYIWRAVVHFGKPDKAPVTRNRAHLSPLGWAHINLTGDYQWKTEHSFEINQFRRLLGSANDEY